MTKSNIIAAAILLFLSMLINLVTGIYYGLKDDLFRCVLCLIATVIFAVFFSGMLLVCKINTRFNKIEDLLSKMNQTG
jgi:ABC-type polysaccharide/polyol phosphate export permease